MNKYVLALSFFLVSIFQQSIAQDTEIRSKEGIPLLNRRDFIRLCLNSLHKNRNDITAVKICECQSDVINGYFTRKHFNKYIKKGSINFSRLIKEDSVIDKSISDCYFNSGQTTLLHAEGFEDEYISSCVKGIQKNTEKKLDSNKVKSFCSCQLEFVKSKKISDLEMETLRNQNSLLFYEMIYKCGDPFIDSVAFSKNWHQHMEKDIKGPPTDTLKILSLNGMTYVKIKIGSMMNIWLFDTGATDLVINKDMEETLKKEQVITDQHYLGIGEYEMANGMIDTCRKYKINNVQIGQYTIDNIIVAVTEKGKRIIAGKTLMNKFRKWVVNNQDNTLILSK
jgi:hypothetical protein